LTAEARCVTVERLGKGGHHARGALFLRSRYVHAVVRPLAVRTALSTETGVVRRRRSASALAPAPARLQLLSCFELAFGDEVVILPPTVQRLVVFLTLRDRPLLRQYVAGTLWPETSEQRAGANLRSALWRLNQLEVRVVEAGGMSLQLASRVRVDLRDRTAQALLLLDADEPDVDGLDETVFAEDLLTDWYDDWLVIERERFHQLRLRALEFVCERLAACGKFARALDAGLAAVAGEPLRESAHRAVVRVHLAEGNRAEAVRQFQLYRELLHDQLGLEPSMHIIELLHA
jgi:DNA-binding SARP family transcriptional activator